MLLLVLVFFFCFFFGEKAARFGSEGCVLRLLKHGAARLKRDKARKTASDLAISAGHLHIAGIVSADPKRLDLMEIAAQVSCKLVAYHSSD